jgi:hypothetical protein
MHNISQETLIFSCIIRYMMMNDHNIQQDTRS